MDQVVFKCFEGQLASVSAIKAAAVLAGRRSSSGLREMMMMMITMLAMMSSPAVVSWTRAPRERGGREKERGRKRDFIREEWKNGP